MNPLEQVSVDIKGGYVGASGRIFMNPAVVFNIPEDIETWEWMDKAKEILKSQNILGTWDEPMMTENGMQCLSTFRASCPEHFDLMQRGIIEQVNSIVADPAVYVSGPSTIEEDASCPITLKIRLEAQSLYQAGPNI